MFKVTAKLKSIMMEAGTLMVSYQPLGELPNFFRSIISNVASREENVYFMLSEMERLGKHLLDKFRGDTEKKKGALKQYFLGIEILISKAKGT